MMSSMPLVTIGIPTFNRAAMLRRSIASALNQDYRRVEVIISDNASSDNTEDVCRDLANRDDRVKCFFQPTNIGATANFTEVLKRASGQYFMWLGDDDWIDASYVSQCMSLLRTEPDVALVGGSPVYYRQGSKVYAGKVFDLLQESWWRRVLRYYAMVTDNGMFYGIMRTSDLRQIDTPNILAGDWHVIANIASLGKCRMIPQVSVHRELGGASTGFGQITKVLGLPRAQARFPTITMVFGACSNIIVSGAAFKRRGVLPRVIIAGIVTLVMLARSNTGIIGLSKRLLLRIILSISRRAENT